jgi:hypothetical protein
MLSQRLLNRVQLVPRETKVLSEPDRPIRTGQLKDGLTTTPDPMNMCRPMVIWINNDTETG